MARDHDVALATDPLFAAEAELHLALEHPHDLLICVTVRLDTTPAPMLHHTIIPWSPERMRRLIFSLICSSSKTANVPKPTSVGINSSQIRIAFGVAWSMPSAGLRARCADALRGRAFDLGARRVGSNSPSMAERYGRKGNMMKWKEQLNGDCPRRDAHSRRSGIWRRSQSYRFVPAPWSPSCLTCGGTLTCFMHPGAQRPWQLIRPDYPQSQVPGVAESQSLNAFLGKQVDMTCDQATNATGPILSKQVKAYAITTKSRLPSLPDLPTADEAGLKGPQRARHSDTSRSSSSPPSARARAELT
jgi:hypothetical protein